MISEKRFLITPVLNLNELPLEMVGPCSVPNASSAPASDAIVAW